MFFRFLKGASFRQQDYCRLHSVGGFTACIHFTCYTMMHGLRSLDRLLLLATFKTFPCCSSVPAAHHRTLSSRITVLYRENSPEETEFNFKFYSKHIDLAWLQVSCVGRTEKLRTVINIKSWLVQVVCWEIWIINELLPLCVKGLIWNIIHHNCNLYHLISGLQPTLLCISVSPPATPLPVKDLYICVNAVT